MNEPMDNSAGPLVSSKKEKAKKITAKEAEDAAVDAGISVIRIKRLKGSSQIGQFIEELGATKVGRATLVIAQEAVEDGLKQCDDVLNRIKEEGSFDFELVAEIMKIRLGLVDQMTKVGIAQTKSPDYHPAVQNGMPPNRAFPPNVQIGISVADDKKLEIKDLTPQPKSSDD